MHFLAATAALFSTAAYAATFETPAPITVTQYTVIKGQNSVLSASAMLSRNGDILAYCHSDGAGNHEFVPCTHGGSPTPFGFSVRQAAQTTLVVTYTDSNGKYSGSTGGISAHCQPGKAGEEVCFNFLLCSRVFIIRIEY